MKTIPLDKLESMKKAQVAYAIAKAWNETNLALDAECRTEELQAVNYPYAEEFAEQFLPEKFCKNPKHDYMIDEKFLDEYYHAIYERRIKKGWRCAIKVENTPNYLITADAESFQALRQAESVLLDAMFDTMPNDLKSKFESAKNNYTVMQKLLTIGMRLDTSNVKK